MTEITIKSIAGSDEAVVLGVIKWTAQGLELTASRDEEAKRELLQLLERLSGGRRLLLRLPCDHKVIDGKETWRSLGASIPVNHPLYPWAVVKNLFQFPLNNGRPVWGSIQDPVPAAEFSDLVSRTTTAST